MDGFQLPGMFNFGAPACGFGHESHPGYVFLDQQHPRHLEVELFLSSAHGSIAPESRSSKMAIVGDNASKGLLLGVVLVGVIFYSLSLLIYRLFFSPLSRIPGPWLTRISTIPEANALKQNRRARWITELFEQNPDAIAIRTSPNSVSFNHPDAVKEIYGMQACTLIEVQRIKKSI